MAVGPIYSREPSIPDKTPHQLPCPSLLLPNPVHSSIETAAPSCDISFFERITSCVKRFFSSLKNSCMSCFCRPKKIIHRATQESFNPPTEILHCKTQASFEPTSFSHKLSHKHKLLVYNTLTKDHPIPREPILFSKYALSSNDLVAHSSVFKNNAQIFVSEGVFSYPPSTIKTIHWTANFADANMFSFCEGDLLAQDELQVLEHPSLAHLRTALVRNKSSFLNEGEIALVKNVYRLGSLDTQTPFTNAPSLYGNNFAMASEENVLARLKIISNPKKSNLFLMVAPIIIGLQGYPYQKPHLEHLFYTAYAAFLAVKQNSGVRTPVIHTGNWGAGAFGNSAKVSCLLQIAAAFCVGIDVIFYPMKQKGDFNSAFQLFQSIKSQSPNMTVNEFLNYLASHATLLNLLYSTSNRT